MATARYIGVWRLQGANALAPGVSNREIGALANPKFTAHITAEPELYFPHIDLGSALGTQLLKGIFTPDDKGTFQERLAAEIANIKARRAQQTEKGVFVVVEGEADIGEPNLRDLREVDDFRICFEAFDKDEFLGAFRPVVQAALTAIGLSLTGDADRKFERIGHVAFLVAATDGKPIYSFQLKGGAVSAYLSSPLTGEVIARAAMRFKGIRDDDKLTRPVALLAASLDQKADPLQAFIASWSALEIFVNAMFKQTYEAEWFKIMETGAPASGRPVFERFKEVMSDKYRVADKFVVIASVLDPECAEADAEEFLRLKKIRDNLLHALDTPAHLPTEQIQKLLLKYLGLHVDA
jgi:hypothetical protein